MLIPSHRRGMLTDDLPDARKFGYEAVIEKALIRARLVDSGMPPGLALEFAIEREYERASRRSDVRRDQRAPAGSHALGRAVYRRGTGQDRRALCWSE